VSPRVAYLVNTYPSPTHTFIKREIDALEAIGTPVTRYAVRRPEGTPQLAGEAEKVRAILDVGARGLLRAVRSTPPAVLARGIAKAARLGRHADKGSLHHVAYLAEACVLRAWAARDGIDHVHVHFGTNGVVVAQLAHAMGGPTYSFTVHGPEEFDRPAALKLRDKVADARFVVAISSFGRSQVLRWARPADWDRVHVVHCAVDDGYLERPTTPVPDVPRIVSIGRLVGAKGQVLLVDAVARLRAEGVAVELVLLGDGELRGEIEHAIAAHDIADSVRLAGWVDNARVADEIIASRALVMPSFAEGLPVSVMEALALGRPGVTTSIAGIPELVRPGVNGWLIAPGSTDDLVDALRELLTTSAERLTVMGKAGAEAVAEQHAARTEAAKLQTLLGS
jgi:glycosyltransferase involved in cell wall biosynthesis